MYTKNQPFKNANIKFQCSKLKISIVLFWKYKTVLKIKNTFKSTLLEMSLNDKNKKYTLKIRLSRIKIQNFNVLS